MGSNPKENGIVNEDRILDPYSKARLLHSISSGFTFRSSLNFVSLRLNSIRLRCSGVFCLAIIFILKKSASFGKLLVTGTAWRCGGIWKTSSLEPLLNRITNVVDNNKSSIVKVKSGQQPHRKQKVEHIFVATPYCQTECWL